MIFADTTPTANSLVTVGQWVVLILSGLATVGLYLQGRKAQEREKKDVRISDQPVEVVKSKRLNAAAVEQTHAEFSRRLDGHDEEIDDLRKKLNDDLPAMERRLNESSEGRASETHSRINDILGEVRELKGEVRANRNKS